MTQFAKCIGTRVVGFFDADEPPTLEEEYVTVVMPEAVPFWPAGPTATAQLHVTNEGGLYWEETASLADLKALKNAEINVAHELANRTSFTFAGKEIQANEHSMVQIQMTDAGIRRRGALRSDWQGAWKTLDNGYVLIPNVATWDQFMDAIEVTGASNFAKAQGLKLDIALAQTAEDIASIDWYNVNNLEE